MYKVAVIILNWNGEKLLREFLPSVIRNTDVALGEIIVADNCSTDASVELLKREFPRVKRILLDRNYGFAGGYNRVIEKVESEYVVLLNSDVAVTEGWLEPLIDLLDKEPNVVGVQPKIRSYRQKNQFEYAGACGGFIDWLGFPFCRGRILDSVEADTGQYDEVMEVFWATGAALCIRRQEYLDAGGLDETFFAHMEEIDLCWRLKNKGYQLKVIPDSVVFHLGGGSLPMNHPRKLFLNYRNNLLMLYKNLGSGHRLKVFTVRFLFDLLAAFLFLLKGEFANARSVYRAYIAYYGLKSKYVPERKNVVCKGVYGKSIVIGYFLFGKKKFSDLRLK